MSAGKTLSEVIREWAANGGDIDNAGNGGGAGGENAALTAGGNARVLVSGVVDVEAFVCDRVTARKILGGIGVSSLWRMEKLGVVRQIPEPFPRGYYSVAHLRGVAERDWGKNHLKKQGDNKP
jgi:hypothetical protein